MDIVYTADNVPVLSHGWNSDYGDTTGNLQKDVAPTEEQFRNAKIHGKYQTMTVRNLFEYMNNHPDLYIVTDSKYTSYDEVVKQFEDMLAIAQENGYEKVFERLIVQIYNNDMLKAVKSVYDFDKILYTMYNRGYDDMDEFTAFCTANDIPVVTLQADVWRNNQAVRDAILNAGLVPYVHTVNDKGYAKELFESGVYGIYSDFIADRDFDKMWETANK